MLINDQQSTIIAEALDNTVKGNVQKDMQNFIERGKYP